MANVFVVVVVVGRGGSERCVCVFARTRVCTRSCLLRLCLSFFLKLFSVPLLLSLLFNFVLVHQHVSASYTN